MVGRRVHTNIGILINITIRVDIYRIFFSHTIGILKVKIIIKKNPFSVHLLMISPIFFLLRKEKVLSSLTCHIKNLKNE